jgi:hypothetical protein
LLFIYENTIYYTTSNHCDDDVKKVIYVIVKGCTSQIVLTSDGLAAQPLAGRSSPPRVVGTAVGVAAWCRLAGEDSGGWVVK